MIAVPTAVSNALSCAAGGVGAALDVRMLRNVFTAVVWNTGSLEAAETVGSDPYVPLRDSCSGVLVMNFTNCSAADMFLVFLKTAMLMPAPMLVTVFPTDGMGDGSGTGATPMSAAFMPSCLSDPEAACQITMAVFPVSSKASSRPKRVKRGRLP